MFLTAKVKASQSSKIHCTEVKQDFVIGALIFLGRGCEDYLIGCEKRLEPVVQLERTGCGIASVGAIVGLSYPEIKSIANSLGISANDKSLWSKTVNVRTLLNHFGVRVSSDEILFSSWKSLPDLALLATKWHVENTRPCWHWVVFVRENEQAFVLDSKKTLRTNKRTDFGRIKPRWYISVEESK